MTQKSLVIKDDIVVNKIVGSLDVTDTDIEIIAVDETNEDIEIGYVREDGVFRAPTSAEIIAFHRARR